MNDFIEEYKKCLESPAYFYNNYCLIRDKTTGEVSKPTKVTDEQIENVKKLTKTQLKLRQPFDVGRLPKSIEKLIENHKSTCE